MDPSDAMRLFERARALAGAESYSTAHRLGDTPLAIGDKAQSAAVQARRLVEPFIIKGRPRA